jgi:hypothetical protein
MKRFNVLEASLIDPFFYVQRKYKDARLFFRTVWQRLIRHDHVADQDIWGAHAVIIKKTYPLIKAFVKYNRHGHPCLEGFYDGNDQKKWDSKGAEKEWERILQEILFAFEFTYQEEFRDRTAKRLEAKMKRLHGDWDAKLPKNISYFFWRDMEDGTSLLIDRPSKLTKAEKRAYEEKDGKNWMEKYAHYYDYKLHFKLCKRAQEGFELFGKYLMNLWD